MYEIHKRRVKKTNRHSSLTIFIDGPSRQQTSSGTQVATGQQFSVPYSTL